MFKFFFIFSFALILITSFSLEKVQATPIPPHKTPKTLHTEHFEMVYYAEQQELAELYARQLERAWIFLGGVFKSKPQERIIVILNDSTDSSNGFATRIPYPYMMLYPVLPDLNDSLSEYEVWSLELAVHELAHVLSFEPVSGVMKPLRSVFGSIIAPNVLLPNWWKEGFSVWTETAIGNGGRLRSIYQESMLRAWYGERNFLDFTIAQANEALPEWPWGSRPYVFGSLMMSSLLEKHGEALMQELVERHGGRVPYMLEGATVPIIGKSYEEFYTESLLDWESRAQKQIQQLSETKLDQPIRIDTKDLNVRSPTISADGNYMAWVGQDARYDARLKVTRLLEKGNLGPVEEVDKGMIREARFFPKSNKIIYNTLKFASQSELYSDLYIYDLETKKKKRLTKELRGREAQVSPDETHVVFVGLEGGKTHLRVLDLDTKTPVTLFSTKFDERVASPLFMDSNHILFSWTRQGQEALYVYDLQSKTTKPFSSSSQAKHLRRPAQIQGDLFYLSDKNHVFNIYNNKTSQALTHVKTSVLDYAIHPTQAEMYAVLMTAQGPQLFYFPQFDRTKKYAQLPAAEPMTKGFTTLKPPPDADTKFEPAQRSYKLWPHYWIPFISGSSAEDGVLFSVSTTGQDPTLQHSYQASLTYDTGVEELSYGFNYVNRTMQWPWFINSTRLARAFVGSDELYYNQAHSISLMPDTSHITEDWGTTISYLYAKYEDREIEFERHGPQLNLAYSNVHQTLFMISPEEGFDAAVNWTHFMKSPQLEPYNQYHLKGSFYFSDWFPERHALAFQGRALITDQKVPSILGDSSTIYASPLTSNYLIRGYLEGQFTGRNIANANAEFRFPLHSFTEGNGLFPFYVRRIHGAVAYDALSVEGFAYREKTKTLDAVDQGKVFSSAGVELRADTTVGYIIPIQWVGGVHYPFERTYKKDPNLIFQVRGDFAF